MSSRVLEKPLNFPRLSIGHNKVGVQAQIGGFYRSISLQPATSSCFPWLENVTRDLYTQLETRALGLVLFTALSARVESAKFKDGCPRKTGPGKAKLVLGQVLEKGFSLAERIQLIL